MPSVRYGKGEPLNHLGMQVDDLDAIETRVVAAGLIPFSTATTNPAAASISSTPTASNMKSSAMPNRKPRSVTRHMSGCRICILF